MLRGASSSDKSTANSPQIQEELFGNKATVIDSLSAISPSIQRISPLKPIVDNTFKDLEIKNLGYQASDFPGTSISPQTWVQQYRAREAAATFPAARLSQPVQLNNAASNEEIEIVIRAAYKQVFGNVHLMESQRLLKAESKLKDGQLTIKDFVRELAKSDSYRSLFFDNCSNIRAIELNFKHLLGRAPDRSQEISEHIIILAEEGFNAEIDSYIDSPEYDHNFGKDTVPYYISYETQTGKNLAGYNRIFQLIKGSCSSDRSIAASIASTKRSQLQQSLLKKADIKKPRVFNPQGFELAKSLTVADFLGQDLNIYASISYPYLKGFADAKPIEFISETSVENQDIVIEAAYKQVFGNAHLMESERLTVAESQLRQGNITVREFVRWLAKSELYKSRFINNCPRYRSHELNFKHLLGRAPDSYQETIYHSNILDSKGYEADIDSYIDSEEYQEAFGDNVVPYYRGYRTQTGKSLIGYTNMFEMLESISTSDKAGINGNKPRLQEQLMSNNPSDIQPVNGSQPITDTVDLIRKVLGIV